MTTQPQLLGTMTAAKPVKAERISGPPFDWIMTFTACWLIGGLYLDGWAHSHGKADSTFFTPWHAVLYSGYAASALIMIGVMLINRARGYGWRRLLPTGYGAARIGIGLFAIAGAGDLVWHTIFGIEATTDALLSPTHLLLAFAGALIVTGPFYAAWQRIPKAVNGSVPTRLITFLPVLLPITAFLGLVTFFTQFAQPLDWPLASREFNYWGSTATRYMSMDLGIGAILLQAAIMTGLILLLVRRWRLPIGSFTLILTLSTALISVLRDSYRFIPSAFVAGVLIDMLYQALNPTVEKPTTIRFFAFVVPIIFYGIYMLTLVLTTGVSWSVHMALGTPVMAGLVGLMLTYIMLPPANASEPNENAAT